MSNGEAAVGEIRALEDRRYKAMVDKDIPVLEGLLHDDLVYTHSNAAADSKQEYLAGIRSGKFDYRKIERPLESIRVYGASAVVAGHVKIDLMMSGSPRSLNSRYLNVWVRGERGWQMVAWQSTPIP
jgi:ketosteroid isomerase-like protein